MLSQGLETERQGTWQYSATTAIGAVDCHHSDSHLTQSQIGKWLADRRIAAGLTQMQAAAAVDKQVGLLSKWERGELRMSAESFLELVLLYRSVDEMSALLRPNAAPVRRVAEPEPPGASRPLTRSASAKAAGRKRRAG